MKKVRLFAVAAAMGMFASTVAAAEPVVSTRYTATWGEVDTIVKVDVGDKVVAPTTTIKVVKETQTTDTEERPVKDHIGFESNEDCYTSTGFKKDENNDYYSDVQMWFNKDVVGYYTTEEDAVRDYLADNHLVLAPGASWEVERGESAYYASYANKDFADYEEAYKWLEEQGLIESVYNEDGDLTKVLINKTEIVDYKDRVVANARIEYKVGTGKRADEDAMKAVVGYVVSGGTPAVDGAFVPTYLKNYTAEDTLPFTVSVGEEDDAFKVDGNTNKRYAELAPGSILIVEEYKGEFVPVEVLTDGVNQYGQSFTAEGSAAYQGYTMYGYEESNDTVKAKTGKVTVYVIEKNKEVSYLTSVSPKKATKYTPESTMAWDTNAGMFVKEVKDYAKLTNTSLENIGYWWAHEHVTKNDAVKTFTATDLKLEPNTLGLVELADEKDLTNESERWVLLVDNNKVSYKNLNKELVALYYNGTKEVVVPGVEIDRVLYPSFASEADLVKAVTKIYAAEAGIKYNTDAEEALELTENYGKNEANYNDFEEWYALTDKALDYRWSGYTHEGDLPESELQGPGTEACSYVVDVKSEEVEATITSDADSVDTSVAGVKTLTLTAKVGEEVVSTKTVSVVVAPKYERTYVNGKVAVLKAFHLNGNLYAEYHYDWTAKTYTATFYAQDGVTVASTANGTL